MQRRTLLTALAAAFGSWAMDIGQADGAEKSIPQPPDPKILKIAMSDGASVALEAGGVGPSILLVHGAAATRKSWLLITPILQSHYQTFAINRRGRVDSSDGSAFSLGREAEDIARAADQLPSPVFVVAHSYGAIATFEALRLSRKIQRCVLYEPPFNVAGGIGGTSPKAVCAAVAAGDNEGAMVAFFRDYANLPAPMIEGFRADPSWPTRVELAPTVCREVKAVSTYALEPQRFSQVTTPTLFLLGGASPQAMSTSVRAGAAALSHSQVQVLPDQQHDAMYTAPAMLSAAITNFLQA